jgi:hypothetical protein
MTEANGGTDPGAQPRWRWDVALSFAGAQRDYVGQVAAALKARRVRCFYDADEEIDLWGKYLAEELPTIYAEQAAAVVVFVSAEYAARNWTRIERRAALARAVRERREYVLPARFDDTPLPGLLPDVSYVDLRGRTPQQFAAMIAAKLVGLGIGPSSFTGRGRQEAAGWVRVSEADPRRLGVHAAISVPGVPDDVLPEYVSRDVDDGEFGVQARVAAAAERGGFVLLVGGSSVGKTRCAVHALRGLLPDWWLVHPAEPGEVATLAAAPSPRTVVWLDELQRYFDGDHALTGGVVRALLNAPHPAVIIATLWPELYSAYTALPARGGADRHAREREVLELADVVRIGSEFSQAEGGRARAAAARDPRLAVALNATGYGLAQTLAAAPQLVARWQDAQTASPYAWAALTAALDVARLGARAPLSADFLRAAAPGYCTSQQLAEAPVDWFEQALAYAIEKLYGAVAALSPSGSRIGQVDGYTVADYLIQHASRERRSARVPASTWDAVLSHIRDPADAHRLADSAQSRLLYRYAIPLYRHAADAGGVDAAEQLADLLTRCGDLDGLRAWADAGSWDAASLLAWLLAVRGDLFGAAQVLRAPADAGDGDAASLLADVLAVRGDLDGAEKLLRARATADDWDAAEQLADVLAVRGDLDGAEKLLRTRANGSYWDATGPIDWPVSRLAHLLAVRGDLDGAEKLLLARANAGEWTAARQLADLLAARGDLDRLRALADAGDDHAGVRLAGLLAVRGELDGAEQLLRVAADGGYWDAAEQLADVLAVRGDLDGAEKLLRAQVDAGFPGAVEQLADLLAGRGDLDGAEQFLRARADAGNGNAAEQLADLLAERDDLDGLSARADVDWAAASRLAKLLEERGDLDGAEQFLRDRVDVGYWAAVPLLAGLLAVRGDLDEAEKLLRTQSDVRDGYVVEQLADLLTGRGDLDEAEKFLRARIDAGYWDAAEQLADVLAGRGDLDEAEKLLRSRIDAGYWAATPRLVELLIKHDRGEEAERLHRYGLNPDGSIASP